MSKPISFSLLRFFVNLILAMLAFVFVLVLAFPIGFYGMAMYVAPSLPSLDELKQAKLAMPLQIYTQDNQLIGQYGNTMSLPVSYEEVPQDMVNAFLAAEDASFFQHSGISVKGIGRAVTEAFSEDEGQTGGSTITMQVAKNYFLSPERTLNRKLVELFLARKIEEKLTKKEIFTLYVNKIYLGEGAYGVRAAAKRYYSKSLNNLSIAEMAMIAGLPKAPSKYNPVANSERALERRNWILAQMLKNGSITKVQYQEAVNAPIGLKIYQAKLDKNHPYLAEMARVALVEQYGKSVMDSGWRVRLTIDSRNQEIADNALKRGLFAYDRRHGWRKPANSTNQQKPANLQKFPNIPPFYPAEVIKNKGGRFIAKMKNGEEVSVSTAYARQSYNGVSVRPNDVVYISRNSDDTGWDLVQLPAVEGALVSLNPDSGALIAVSGGFDFNKSTFNRALQGYRQSGSTIKPLVYTTALEKGFSPDTIVSDDPLKVGNWTPKNSDGRYLGSIPLRQGLYLSRNLVSIRVLRSAGIADTREMLSQFGLEKNRMPTTLSLALGAGEATPIQMATAYATIANGGHRIQPYFIEQLFDYSGKLIYQANPQQACATCFNSQLDAINAKNLKAFEIHQKNTEKAKRKKINLLDENPIDNEDNKTDKDNETETLTKKDRKSSNNKDTNNKNTKETDKKSEKNQPKTQLYDADPDSDKLAPSAVQHNPSQQAPRIIASSSALQMADMLRDVIQRGTAKKAQVIGRSDLGGKTGTTNHAKDAWFAGIHPTMSTIVWVGFDQPKGLGKGEFGGVAALPIWIDFTSKMLKGVPIEWVSVNNRAKSKKQEQETIELTDGNEQRLNRKDHKLKNNQPPKAVAQKRPEEADNQTNFATLDSDTTIAKPKTIEPKTTDPKDTQPSQNKQRNIAQIETNRRVSTEEQ
ncbi:penicillin-binding protein 1A [Moraxella macacae 0408225]|uniref:peptidoglycan glycosyltransferase n=1 Tax=Moraxella macacae 0408225 TaxID=1230338 RepID=L2FAE7_9GAMM|nr:transglycosylase domain-containing protein [Moraxella macacae]ELA09438.1 penicillin-binding protein 1A [Moraxella macacae 0408225]